MNLNQLRYLTLRGNKIHAIADEAFQVCNGFSLFFFIKRDCANASTSALLNAFIPPIFSAHILVPFFLSLYYFSPTHANIFRSTKVYATRLCACICVFHTRYNIYTMYRHVVCIVIVRIPNHIGAYHPTCFGCTEMCVLVSVCVMSISRQLWIVSLQKYHYLAIVNPSFVLTVGLSVGKHTSVNCAVVSASVGEKVIWVEMP